MTIKIYTDDYLLGILDQENRSPHAKGKSLSARQFQAVLQVCKRIGHTFTIGMAILCATLVFGGQALAYTDAEKDQICPAMGSLAKEVMSRRQEGLPMSTLISALKNKDATADGIIRSMIKAAYSQPQYNSDEIIQQTIMEFQNTMEYECYK